MSFVPRQILTAQGLNALLDAIEALQGIVVTLGGWNYQGSWNAATNSPALVSGSGVAGQYYAVAVAGTTEIDGISSWQVSDKIVFNGTNWEKFDGGYQEVLSVAGLYGAISKAAIIAALAGTAEGDLVKLVTGGKLPAVDGSNLTNITTPVSSVFGRTGVVAAQANDYAIADINGLVAALAGKETADANIIKSNATKTLAAGYPTTSLDAGTKSSGTFTPDPTARLVQHAINGGAHTLAAPAAVCTMVIEYANNASAGAITPSGFDVVLGTPPDTTDGLKYQALIVRSNSMVSLTWVVADA